MALCKGGDLRTGHNRRSVERRDEAIRMANESHDGLAAFIWTRDRGKALRTAHAIDSGWIQINQGIGILRGQSYGGVKMS